MLVGIRVNTSELVLSNLVCIVWRGELKPTLQTCKTERAPKSEIDMGACKVGASGSAHHHRSQAPQSCELYCAFRWSISIPQVVMSFYTYLNICLHILNVMCLKEDRNKTITRPMAVIVLWSFCCCVRHICSCKERIVRPIVRPALIRWNFIQFAAFWR